MCKKTCNSPDCIGTIFEVIALVSYNQVFASTCSARTKENRPTYESWYALESWCVGWFQLSDFLFFIC